MLRKIVRRIYQHSPADNVLRLRQKLSGDKNQTRNEMLDELTGLVSFPRILAWALRRLPHKRVELLGYSHGVPAPSKGKSVTVKKWEWNVPLALTEDTAYVICIVPRTAEEWVTLRALRAPNVFTLGEIVAPFSQITLLMKRLDYFFHSADELMPFYLGEDFFGPLREIDALFPLAGKRVIEFGPFDGYQTLGLAHLGAEVTAIDARAENVTKTRAALDATGMSGQVRMDDFHNVDAVHYGRFDLAFAHGVYYHSIAPFLFLENLISLSDNIFVGGFCATDDLPSGPWHALSHGGGAYRVKPYREGTDYSAGINDTGYFFHGEDLMAFFSDRRFSIDVISDEPERVPSGRYLRFLARRIPSP